MASARDIMKECRYLVSRISMKVQEIYEVSEPRVGTIYTTCIHKHRVGFEGETGSSVSEARVLDTSN